ncbi:MAG: DMT family transporter [Rhodobacterales bacterium]|nr:DMT family transporter [Rhodobacterales bacterium]
METWVLLSVGAAFFQTLRFVLQKQLAAVTLSTGGATFARFFYSVPLILALLAGYLAVNRLQLPEMNATFWGFALIGGLGQVLATLCVVALFKLRNFAVGITFKNTEVMQTAVVGLVVLNEGVSWAVLGAIFIGLIGVLVLSDTPERTGDWRKRIFNRAAGLGLLSGFLFGISGVCYRGASLEIASDDAALRAIVTLAAVSTAQLIGMGIWLSLRQPGQIAKVIAARRTAGLIGITSMAGSLCWFTAFTLQNAAIVKAVGQVELIFSLLASLILFNERLHKQEVLGIALIALSVLALIL